MCSVYFHAIINNLLLLDTEVQKVIDKVVEYLIRSPEFEAKLHEKEQNNPKFSFLFGGENSDYYQWKMFCARNPGAGRKEILFL